MTIAAFSAFSGAGSVLLGEWLGWRHVGACDRDAFCRAVIAERLPHVPLFDDMDAVPWETAWSDCSPADGHASRTASPASASPAPTSATAGPSCSTPFAVVDPTSRSSRTSQESFLAMADATGPDASPTWPAAGTMRNGWCWERPVPSSSPAATTDDSGCGSSPGAETRPTPCATDAASAANRTSGRTNPDSAHHDGLTLLDAVRLAPAAPPAQWATPLASDAAKGGLTFSRGNPTLKGQVALWPTPTLPSGGRKAPEAMSPTGQMPDGKKRQVDLSHAVAQWPTPNATAANDGETAATWEARREQVLASRINGNCMGMPLSIAVQKAGETGTKLNPAWVAMLLGWPPRWTGLPAAAIARLRQENRSARASLRGPARTTRAATTSCEPWGMGGTSLVRSLPGESSSSEPDSAAFSERSDA